MGVEPYMLSAALVGIIAQRLVRKVCPVCKKQHRLPNRATSKHWAFRWTAPARFYMSEPDAATVPAPGFKGRMAVHEILVVNSEVRESDPSWTMPPPKSGTILTVNGDQDHQGTNACDWFQKESSRSKKPSPWRSTQD